MPVPVPVLVVPMLVVVVGVIVAVEIEGPYIGLIQASVPEHLGAEGGDKPLVVLLTTETNVTVLCAKAVEAATRAAGRMVEGRIFAG